MIEKYGKIGGILAAILLVVGCSDLRLVPAYDPEIETGLNAYHVEVLDFISTMETSRASLKGSYKGETVSAYYAASNAALGNLVVQAEASEPDATCGQTRLSRLGLAGLGQRTEELANDLGNVLGSDLVPDGDEIARGSCTVITLRVLQANHKSMQDLHRIEGRLVPPTSTITRDLLNDSVRIALTTEKAKK
ncbi:hypothetical protein [Sedimentitalea todarodis]|uniref:Lipoprotein n=1 Tax=Sedimentitalea todarodis TaxID=1631240 RepID=A0ABU3V9Z8_9RHOB|nr:hypothetical protein [Sedimentitalea todarodis]MDU9002993.1 hypothetical protein [Sedimentitalea todarodis]